MLRRHFLKAGGLVSASFALSGCLHKRPAVSSFVSTSYCGLRPVHVSEDREIRTQVGLRPFRPSGFVVRAEKVDNKVVIHDYGHGGSGITLSWGTASLALSAGLAGHSGPVAVIGCGAVGLATARLVQEAGFQVQIYAKDLPPNTTSNVAGGQWFPFLFSDPDKRTPEFMEQLVRAATFAYMRYQTMLGPRYGVRWIRNFYLSSEPVPAQGLMGKQSPIRALLPELRDLQPSEVPFTGYPFIRQFDTMLIEPSVCLRAMLDDFLLSGGKVTVMELPDRPAVSRLPENLIFNCTGLGSRSLFGDEELIPVKGQITVLLPQPEVDYILLPEGLYMFPRSDGIVLGGTHERGDWSLTPDLAAKQFILASHKEIFDSFKRCVQ
ncbi:MAG: FAD-dependent oxidoreductase [Terriglobia bacterium]|jgi:glycine/D-amino acid oxidase-like deaminating enzyme